jgi:hypothetical protein
MVNYMKNKGNPDDQVPNGTSPEKLPEDERLSDREDYKRAEEGYGEHEMTTAQRERAAEMTDPERRREIQRKWSEGTLPNLPKKQGWHSCWVSTTHPSDTPLRRKRFGYRFINYEDLTQYGWAADIDAIKDGHFAGAVMWRELIAMECTNQEYEAYMREFHLDQPSEAVEGIFQNLDETNEQARRKGGRITLEEDMADLRKRMQRPPAYQFEN